MIIVIRRTPGPPHVSVQNLTIVILQNLNASKGIDNSPLAVTRTMPNFVLMFTALSWRAHGALQILGWTAAESGRVLFPGLCDGH